MPPTGARELKDFHGALPNDLSIEPLIHLDGFEEPGGNAVKVLDGLAKLVDRDVIVHTGHGTGSVSA